MCFDDNSVQVQNAEMYQKLWDAMKKKICIGPKNREAWTREARNYTCARANGASGPEK